MHRSLMESFLTPTSLTSPTSTPSTSLTRTAEQVRGAAQAAGLTSTQGPVQLLRFSPMLNTEDYKLLEVPPQVLSSLSNGKRCVGAFDTINRIYLFVQLVSI